MHEVLYGSVDKFVNIKTAVDSRQSSDNSRSSVVFHSFRGHTKWTDNSRESETLETWSETNWKFYNICVAGN